MRILTLVTGENSLPDAVSLTGEIRSFNAEIDFRLRFLHIEIEEVYAAIPELREKLAKQVERARREWPFLRDRRIDAGPRVAVGRPVRRAVAGPLASPPRPAQAARRRDAHGLHRAHVVSARGLDG